MMKIHFSQLFFAARNPRKRTHRRKHSLCIKIHNIVTKL